MNKAKRPNWHKRLQGIIAIVLCMSLLTGCGIFDAAGDKLANTIVDKYDPLAAYDLSLNDPAPQFNPNNPNGVVLYETVLLEDVLKEDILHEDILKEQILKELTISESIIYEDVIIESVLVEVIEDVDELDDFFCESYHSELLDYSFIRQRLADGMALVLAEVVIDIGSAVINIITCNWGELAIDAGQIVLTAGGTTLAAFVAGEIAKVKSLAAGNSYEVAMYDCLDAASSAYYYTAVGVDIFNTVVSTVQLVRGIYTIGKNIVNRLKNIEKIYDSAGNVVAKRLKDTGNIEVKVNKKTHTCRVTPDGHLYDIKTGKYVGTLVEVADDAVEFTVKKLPAEIYDNGRLKFTIEDGMLYKITQTKSGEITRTCKGSIDAGGVVRNAFGQIVEKIDLNTGKRIGNYQALATTLQKAGASNVTVNPFGELVEVVKKGNTITEIPIEKKLIDNVVTYVQNVDGVEVPLLTEYVGKDGVTYLKQLSDVDNGKTVGAITDGILDGAWKDVLNQRRGDATQAVRKAISKFVEEKPDRVIRKYFPQLTAEQIDYIRSYGKLPSDFEIHHVKNVANYPDLADDFSNLEMLSHEAHKAAHSGAYSNATVAPSETYVDLTQVLAGYFS